MLEPHAPAKLDRRNEEQPQNHSVEKRVDRKAHPDGPKWKYPELIECWLTLEIGRASCRERVYVLV